MAMNLIYDYNLEDLERIFLEKGYKKYRALQVFKWLYQKRAVSFEVMSDISASMIEELARDYQIDSLKLQTSQVSSDKTTKLLFELNDGYYIESVIMYFDYGISACISTQVGCNMGCSFCASGLLKKKRDLSCGEIVNQVLNIQRLLDKDGERLDNIVVMGTGEPFDNYDNVIKAMGIINHAHGLAIGARHISISTSGLVPMIRKFANEGLQYNLAISLHAANDDLRDKLMPVNKAYPLDQLMDAVRYYSEHSSRRITFEYLLLDGINDREKDADDLKKLLQGLNAYINLIPYNRVEEMSYSGSSELKTLQFYDLLKKRNIAVTIRQKKGDDIDAACGQLRAKYEN